jgi:PPK2 family polyphosphate:nucleotide phosphotransferase
VNCERRKRRTTTAKTFPLRNVAFPRPRDVAFVTVRGHRGRVNNPRCIATSVERHTVHDVLNELRVTGPAKLAKRSTDTKVGLRDKQQAHAKLAKLHEQLADLQNKLFAEHGRSLLVVIQAMDAGGKDGVIRTLGPAVNPAGVHVAAFKAPSTTELDHDFLWRLHQQVPPKGHITIFNRSHYEDVVVVRVNDLVTKARWQKRYAHIRSFEDMLIDEGTDVVKIFLNISKEEQRLRQQDRIDDPTEQWKFRKGDLDDRARWDEFIAAYDDAITKTSTARAPWYVIPSDRKWVRDVAVATVLVHHLQKINPKFPPAEAGIKGLKVV